ncbi:MAG TPA: CHASE3 domain-containing protein, partial [Chthoniobacterales bacterium]|nr:CHASE3 domain-containing protein [Chthoniobacterales bacterium]
MKRRLAAYWDDLSLRRKGWIVIAAPVAAMLAAVTIFGLGKRIGDAAEVPVRQALECQARAQLLLTLLVDSETAVRGYLLTGDDAFLQPKLRATALLPGAASA